jgi:arginyl-tRNA synthetase
MIFKQKLAKALEKAAISAQQQGILAFSSLPELLIERPQNQKYGDYASSLPLKLARGANLKPMQIAEKIIEFLPSLPEIDKVDIAPPGFINFSLSQSWLMQQVEVILDSGDSYGNSDTGKGKNVQVEFVSVNPTGPLHVGHGRGAVLGSTLANVLKSLGFNVQKEYYINDAGSQLDAFNRTLFARYKQCLGEEVPMPEDGYMGQYMIDLAKEIIAEEGSNLNKLTEQDILKKIGMIGLNKMLSKIKLDLALLGVEFDNWFSEKSLFTSKLYDKVMKVLKKNGHLAERESATWFISSAMGDDKDNVLVRTDGSPTYFASDIAYHYNKFIERKNDLAIDLWGADHQGHVSRMAAAIKALGISPEKLKIIIYQLVTLRRGDEVVRLSKRSGDIITMREVLDEVGRDACRFAFLSRSADSQMDFDLELAKKQSDENPVYYVQYAHARIASILKLADQQGIGYGKGDVSLLSTDSELLLIKKMVMLEEILETIAETYEPHHLTYYAQDLATTFHGFYKQCRVISTDQNITQSRLNLVRAAQIILARTLHLMGISAPDSM